MTQGHKRKTGTSLIQKFFLFIGGLVIGALLLEGLLHLLPVNELLLMQPVNEEQPAMRFAPSRTSQWSKFADFSMTNMVRSNNYGFLNDQNYDSNGSTPLVTVIGDSFIEAVMVPYAETMHGRLADDLAGAIRVYSLAVSGAPLSQYLAYADWARREFHPEKMVFVVVGNDFDESLVKYKRSSGLHFFRPVGGRFELERVDYTPGIGVKVVTRSKLLMYLLTNVHIFELVQQWIRPAKEAAYVGQTDASANTERVADSMLAVEEFFRRLPAASGLNPDDICFVIDGMRPHLYSSAGLKAAQESYYDIMRKGFMKSALEQGYKVVDMQPRFVADFIANGKAFEYPRDGHWNGYAHGLAAKAVLESGLLDEMEMSAQ